MDNIETSGVEYLLWGQQLRGLRELEEAISTLIDASRSAVLDKEGLQVIVLRERTRYVLRRLDKVL